MFVIRLLHEGQHVQMFALFLGKKIGLSEFQAVMYRRDGSSKSPVVLLFPKESERENVPHLNGYAQPPFTCHS